MSMSPPDMVSTFSTKLATARPAVESGAWWFWIRNVVVCAAAGSAASAATAPVTRSVLVLDMVVPP